MIGYLWESFYLANQPSLLLSVIDPWVFYYQAVSYKSLATTATIIAFHKLLKRRIPQMVGFNIVSAKARKMSKTRVYTVFIDPSLIDKKQFRSDGQSIFAARTVFNHCVSSYHHQHGSFLGIETSQQ